VLLFATLLWTGRHGFLRGYDNFRTTHRGAVERDDACDVAVIAGLLIAFLASPVWSNLDRANSDGRAGGERDP